MEDVRESLGKTIQVVLSEDGRPRRILLEKAVPPTGRLLVAVKRGEEAMALPNEPAYDQAVQEIDVPGLGRVELQRRGDGDSEILLVSDQSLPEVLTEVLEPEAYDFLTKPMRVEELAELAEEAENLAPESAAAARKRLEARLGTLSSDGGPILAESPAMNHLLQTVERIAASGATVLIQGETGCGKGVVARLLHDLSPRKDKRFVAINCSAFQDQLLESELFGHEKGAFTGALAAKPGLFEVADEGTLFLDEVAEMTSAMQAKLLQVLDSGELRRVGSTRQRQVEARIVAASNRDLKEEVEKGNFREDLLFRLNVVTLRVPPLRERREEIPDLIEGFVQRFQARGLSRKSFTAEALGRLAAYRWPGNVRELANTIEGLLLLTQGEVVQLRDLPEVIRQAPGSDGRAASAPEAAPERDDVPPVPLTEVEKDHVARVLRYTKGKKAPAARILGIDVKTLNKKIKSYEIDLPR